MTRLVIFDVDGTLVDSQALIVAAMTAAFEGAGLTAPPRPQILSIVGLSLPHAMARLAPDAPAPLRAQIERGYRDSYFALRSAAGPDGGSPLYPGAAEALGRLRAAPDTLLALATGKSRRGVTALIESHGWVDVFASVQTADDHPSKPDPAMLRACLAETGVSADRAVMVGDTSFDIDMARAAGIASVAVGWGYHPPAMLGADHAITDFAALDGVLDALLGTAA